MAYIRIVKEDEAQGQLAEDYAYLSRSYSNLMGAQVRTPPVYHTQSRRAS